MTDAKRAKNDTRKQWYTRWPLIENQFDDKYIKDARPVEEGCDCLACRRYSRGYLRHLYRANEAAFQRLATIHNLRFMARLMDALRHG